MSVLFLLLGCYPVETYQSDLDEAVCTWKASCYDEDAAACLAAAEAARRDADPACEYQSDEARECVDGMEALPCPFGDTGGADEDDEAAFGFPSACEKVWECP